MALRIRPIVKQPNTTAVKAAWASNYHGRIGRWSAGVTFYVGLVLLMSGPNVWSQTPDEVDPALARIISQPGGVTTRPQTGGVTTSSQPGGVTTTVTTRIPTGAQRSVAGAQIAPERLPPAAPDQLTEFQRMVSATTGRQLPIFGAALFSAGLPSTFAPVDDIPVAPDYVIGPGDELRLQIWGQVNQEGSFVVDRTGAISVPQMGTIHAAGQHYDQLNEFLKSEFGRVYRNFSLNVTMGQLRSIQVFVVGQARRPGSYTVSSLSTLLNALFASGGPLPQGSLRDIQVRRGAQTIVHFDLYDLLLHGDKSKDVPLSPGDVIFIPTVGPQVALLGSVNNPAIYELKSGAELKSDPKLSKEALGTTSVSDLLELSGGRTSSAVGSQVRLERIVDHAVLSVVDIDLSWPDSVALQNGDIVSVTSIVDRFKDAVTLRGNVANPGRYVWHTGMRITDLIPSKDALVTRNYWEKRNQLGQLPNVFQQQTDSGSAGALQVKGSGDAATSDSVVRGGTAQAGEGGSSLGSALAASSGVFPGNTDVVLSAPDINWSYAVIERQNAADLTTHLIPFSLGKVILDGDQGQNLELLPGDVVTIFSTADVRVATSQQTRYVRLEGEFAASGIYSVRPGETLRQLLARAGGLTPDAYLYGSEFTRQSTRRVEQQRLNEFADQLEAQVSAETSKLNTRAVTDRDTAAAAAAATNAQAAIARLRQVRPVGRIVLPLKPDSRTIDDVPDLALEDGDRFVVPRTPSNVSVEGQVYSSNAFVYEHGRRVRDYLKMAGGPSRQADANRMFVVRADGSVYSRQYGDLAKALVFPGDTIVVPLQIDRRAALRTLVDVASVVGQFGLGAAAINVLK
jgi:polysaccharide biosynthesis/export protein